MRVRVRLACTRVRACDGRGGGVVGPHQKEEVWHQGLNASKRCQRSLALLTRSTVGTPCDHNSGHDVLGLQFDPAHTWRVESQDTGSGQALMRGVLWSDVANGYHLCACTGGVWCTHTTNTCLAVREISVQRKPPPHTPTKKKCRTGLTNTWACSRALRSTCGCLLTKRKG
jgi:hypothetical protein